MSCLCKVLSSIQAWLCCALVLALPAIVQAAPVTEQLAFLGVSILEQPDSKLSEFIGRRLARMGEELLPRVRTKYCKESTCFSELAQTASLRQARFLLSAEIYQSDARQQSVTVRLFDVEHNKLEESVEGCEQCDDDRRSELILVKYSQLRQKLTNPPPSEPPPPPLVVDVCPNLPDIQAAIPDDKTADAAGNCVPKPNDLCPNIAGEQAQIPKGMTRDKLGNCMVPSLIDLCLNLDGIQAKVPAGMAKDDQGVCTAKQESSDPEGRKRRLRTASIITGGMAIGLLVAGIAYSAMSLRGDTDCTGIDTSGMMGSCHRSYTIPVITFSAAGALGLISIGTAIPLGRKN